MRPQGRGALPRRLRPDDRLGRRGHRLHQRARRARRHEQLPRLQHDRARQEARQAVVRADHGARQPLRPALRAAPARRQELDRRRQRHRRRRRPEQAERRQGRDALHLLELRRYGRSDRHGAAAGPADRADEVARRRPDVGRLLAGRQRAAAALGEGGDIGHRLPHRDRTGRRGLHHVVRQPGAGADAGRLVRPRRDVHAAGADRVHHGRRRAVRGPGVPQPLDPGERRRREGQRLRGRGVGERPGVARHRGHARAGPAAEDGQA